MIPNDKALDDISAAMQANYERMLDADRVVIVSAQDVEDYPNLRELVAEYGHDWRHYAQRAKEAEDGKA